MTNTLKRSLHPGPFVLKITESYFFNRARICEKMPEHELAQIAGESWQASALSFCPDQSFQFCRKLNLDKIRSIDPQSR